MAEISEQDLAAFTALNNLHQKMLKSPAAREQLLRAVKAADPTIVNEIDQAERYIAPVKQELDDAKKELQDLRKQWVEDKAARDLAAQQAKFESEWGNQETSLRRQGYIDSAINDIKALAARKGIVDLTDAAAIYDKTAPAPAPVSSRFSALTLTDGKMQDTDDEYVKALFNGGGNAPGATRKQVENALNEARGRAA